MKLKKPQLKSDKWKYIMWASIILGTAASAYIIYKQVRKGVKNARNKREGKDIVRDAEKNLNKNNLTHDDIWYKQAAQRMFTAMNYAGTNNDTVFDIARSIKTKDDYLKFVLEFGVKTGTPGLWREHTGELSSWLEVELSGGEYEEFKEILAENNVYI
jgi:hypothetical protein